jgi:spore germination protein YaaH
VSASISHTLLIKIFHTVSSGETLWSIAQRYGTTPEAIITANQITNPALIKTGLRIPVQTHTIRSGETLWQSEEHRSNLLNHILSTIRTKGYRGDGICVILHIKNQRKSVGFNRCFFSGNDYVIRG